MEITPSWFGGLNFCHSTGVISFSYKPFPSTRLAGGFLFRTFRPQLAKALIKLWAGGRMENNLVWGQGNSAIWI